VQTIDEINELKVQNEQKGDGEKFPDFSNDSSANTSTWTQESLAKLVGFEEGEDVNSSSQVLSNTQGADSSPRTDSNNILTDAELFGTLSDDSAPQSRPLSSNPWSKFAFVGSGLLAVFFLAGLILSQITGSKSGKEPTQFLVLHPLWWLKRKILRVALKLSWLCRSKPTNCKRLMRRLVRKIRR
jgi:hypothetical protein